MTDKQPEALRLANELGGYVYDDRREWSDSEYVDNLPNNYIRDAAAELRRLHDVNGELVEALRLMNIECQHLHHAKKDQHGYDVACPVVERIKASIAKATGKQQ